MKQHVVVPHIQGAPRILKSRAGVYHPHPLSITHRSEQGSNFFGKVGGNSDRQCFGKGTDLLTTL